MESEYLVNYAMWIWISTGLTLMFFEIVMGFPIIMFISGLSAFTTALMLWILSSVNGSVTYQIIIFLAGIPLWALVLWHPLKRALKKNKKGENFSNIIGQIALVDNPGLSKKQIGSVIWSGTIVRARLVENDINDNVSSGKSVRIVEVKDNIFIVRSID